MFTIGTRTPKVCRFKLRKKASSIECDFKKFQSLDQPSQYVLIHHEFAGLAQIELPNQEDSNYEISNQLKSFLEDVVVKKLVVKDVKHTQPYKCSLNETKLAKIIHKGGNYIYNLVAPELVKLGISLAEDPKAMIIFNRNPKGSYPFHFIKEIQFQTASGTLLKINISSAFPIMRSGGYDKEGNLINCLVTMSYDALIYSVENVETRHKIFRYDNGKKFGREVIATYWE